MRVADRIAVSIALLIAGGCADDPLLALGAQCSLSSECEAPLACRLERCRIECATARDCPVGQACVQDELGLGACQLPDELDCNVDGNCTAPLVCRFRRCVNECAADADCPPGSVCREDEEGTLGCLDAAEVGCVADSECPPSHRCGPDARCRPECRNDRDCARGTMCVEGLCLLPPRPGAGTDAGTDAGDAGLPDGGTDAGSLDAGTDAGPADAGVTPLAEAVYVGGAGTGSICAVRGDGTVVCWGDVTIPFVAASAYTPIPVGAPANARHVSVGPGAACAIDTSDALLCWGEGSGGLLGDGTTSDHETPASPTGVPSAVDVAVGPGHACAVTSTGEVWCWGANGSGQVGVDPFTSSFVLTPVRAGTIADAAAVAVGDSHTCVLHSTGAVSCFGRNDSLQLGQPLSVDESFTPTAVAGIEDAVEIAAGAYYNCARLSTGAVSCWGSGTNGQLGHGVLGFGVQSATPVSVEGLADAADLAAGFDHACAARTGGGVVCWGKNSSGQLGDLTHLRSAIPVAVVGLADATGVSANDETTCALRAGGQVACWGSNQLGGLGIGDPGVVESTRPVTVVAP